MFRDKEEELQRLQSQLLEDEEKNQLTGVTEDTLLWEDLDETQVFAAIQDPDPRKIRNTDHMDIDLAEYADEVENGTRGLTGLTVTALLLCGAIAALLLWWVLRFL